MSPGVNLCYQQVYDYGRRIHTQWKDWSVCRRETLQLYGNKLRLYVSFRLAVMRASKGAEIEKSQSLMKFGQCLNVP